VSESNNPELEDTGLTESDYTQLLRFSWKEQLVTFVAIFAVVYGMFYWFQTSMEANAGKKIQQVRSILDRAEDLSAEPTPRTLELEQMARRTDNERNQIVRELGADSFAENFEGRLRDRFLNRTTYLDPPDDWQSRLPPELQQWADRKRRERTRNIKAFLSDLGDILERIRERIDRVETIRQKKDLKAGTLGGELRRYETVRDRILNEIRDVEDQLQGASVREPNIPEPLFRETTDLIDPMTTLAMHFRNFSAFSSAPSAYYHSYRLLHDALRIDPENPAAHYQLGRLYRRLKLHDLAGEQMARALRYNPNFKREDILTELKRRQEQSPKNARANYYLAFALHETGELEKAEKYLTNVLELERNRHSMVKVLARKRLDYVRSGEPDYSKLTLF
jgi:tetratricopeptide (TPR) repeat protein